MIDGHAHVWRLHRNGCTWPTPAEGLLYRDFVLDELWAAASPLGVRAAIVVQSQEHPADTDWLLGLAADDSRIAAIVGWTDLAAADAPRRVRTLAATPKLAGLRPMVQHRPASWYDRPDLAPGLAAMADGGLCLDALIRTQHLPALTRLASRFPMPIVVDHAAKPHIGDRNGFLVWREGIGPLADHGHVAVKLSGMLSECGAEPAATIVPYVEALIALFGTDRIIWGSDWPVLNAVSTYSDWQAQALDLVPAPAHGEVFGGNARRFYRLAPEPQA